MKTKKFTLTLNVEIDPQGETTTAITQRLNQVVKDAINNGTLTGDSPATVEKYDYTVTEIKPKKKEKETLWLIVNDNDPNDSFEVEATSKNVADKALLELGWWVAKQD